MCWKDTGTYVTTDSSSILHEEKREAHFFQLWKEAPLIIGKRQNIDYSCIALYGAQGWRESDK